MPDIHQNLIGKHFGHLTVIAKSTRRGSQHEYLWVCQCDCGNATEVSTAALNSGQVKSCGHIKLKNLQSSEHRHQTQLGDKPPRTNTSGFRNIGLGYQKTSIGVRRFYKIYVMYNKKQHMRVAYSLLEALQKREILRSQHWPNYDLKKLKFEKATVKFNYILKTRSEVISFECDPIDVRRAKKALKQELQDNGKILKAIEKAHGVAQMLDNL